MPILVFKGPCTVGRKADAPAFAVVAALLEGVKNAERTMRNECCRAENVACTLELSSETGVSLEEAYILRHRFSRLMPRSDDDDGDPPLYRGKVSSLRSELREVVQLFQECLNWCTDTLIVG